MIPVICYNSTVCPEEFLKIHPKVLDTIRTYLIPDQKDKKDFGEVFTPLELVCEMLSKLPKKVWSDPSLVWLDPANGIGNFPVVVYYKLMDGLKKVFPNEAKRSKHIIEKMLFMIELNPVNVSICKKIFKMLDSDSKPNIYTGNTLELNQAKLKVKGFPDKYDIIIGNPPFQNGRNASFYVYFIDFANQVIKKNGYLLYVIPNKILIPNKANAAIQNFNPIYIYHTVNAFFPTISTTICAIICKKEPFDTKTKVKFSNGEMILDLKIPTPTEYNDTKLKELSDKILFGKGRKYLTTSKEEPSKSHIYKSCMGTLFPR